MIDHLVYITHHPDEAVRSISSALGVAFSPGGRHPDRSTRNQLLRIGMATYLEVLSADPNGAEPSGGRWMGLDLLPPSSPGRLSRWAYHVREEDAPRGLSFGSWQPGARTLADGSTLRWKLTDPGTEPLISVQPFLIDWQGAASPASLLPDQGLTLERLVLKAPEAPDWPPTGGELPLAYQYQSNRQIIAYLRSPDGRSVVLL